MSHAVVMQGGLGDMLLALLRQGQPAGYVRALREREPLSWVRCSAMCTSPRAALRLLRGLNLFDEVNVEAWDGDGATWTARQWRGFEPVPKVGEWERPALFEDWRPTTKIVALHPFAGTPDRDWRGKLDARLVAEAIEATGAHVFVLGGSGRRLDGKGMVRDLELREGFEHAPGVTSLVGQAPVSLQAHIAATCDRFVGSFSAYHCAAFSCGRPAFVMVPEAMRGFVEDTEHPIYGRLSQRSGARFGYFEEFSQADQIERITEWAAHG